MTTLVACGWTRAVLNLLIKDFGQGAMMQKPLVNAGLANAMDGPTDRRSYQKEKAVKSRMHVTET